ncbi:hypothetical protein C8R45DRAFT_567564 [Mycena sanguinolenta]|nr:hypothetical protein C8R45DRAFT_567564 [Mycena sanguinolenta]
MLTVWTSSCLLRHLICVLTQGQIHLGFVVRVRWEHAKLLELPRQASESVATFHMSNNPRVELILLLVRVLLPLLSQRTANMDTCAPVADARYLSLQRLASRESSFLSVLHHLH